jgi:glycosyltransferase involved in cell wall biosynthesis
LDASILIPTHNRHKWVLRAVGALIRQSHPAASYEIIVSCDRCTDGTEESLRSTFGDRVSVVKSVVPGQAAALNASLKYARGEIAIFLDDEMEAAADLVSAHVYAQRVRRDTRKAVTGYSAVVIDSSATPYTRMVARHYENYFTKLAQSGRENSPKDLCGSNFSLPLAVFREVGGFNESYLRNDFELAIRLLRFGYEIRFCRAARANQHLAITPHAIIARAAERAQNDYRLACEYPWCIPHLPFYRVLTNSAVRRRWRVLWETSRQATGLFMAARRLCTDSLRLINLEYATRYCAGLRDEIGDWKKFCRLANS